MIRSPKDIEMAVRMCGVFGGVLDDNKDVPPGEIMSGCCALVLLLCYEAKMPTAVLRQMFQDLLDQYENFEY